MANATAPDSERLPKQFQKLYCSHWSYCVLHAFAQASGTWGRGKDQHLVVISSSYSLKGLACQSFLLSLQVTGGRGIPQTALPISTQILVGGGGQLPVVVVTGGFVFVAVVVTGQGVVIVVTDPGGGLHFCLLHPPSTHPTQHSLISLQNLAYSKHLMALSRPAFLKHAGSCSSHTATDFKHPILSDQSGTGGAHQSPIWYSYLGVVVMVVVQSVVVVQRLVVVVGFCVVVIGGIDVEVALVVDETFVVVFGVVVVGLLLVFDFVDVLVPFVLVFVLVVDDSTVLDSFVDVDELDSVEVEDSEVVVDVGTWLVVDWLVVDTGLEVDSLAVEDPCVVEVSVVEDC